MDYPDLDALAHLRSAQNALITPLSQINAFTITEICNRLKWAIEILEEGKGPEVGVG